LATVLPAAIQIHNAYIVTGCQDGLLVVDQHALHERLVYNDLKRRIAEGTLSGQRLLIPEPVQVTPAEDDALQRHADLLARMGIEAAPFGPSTVALQQFPTLLAERGVPGRQFLREILDCLSEEESTDPERLLESLLETLACKAAVKAGDPLKPEEIASLLARREEAEKGSACPHGRPTTLKLTLKDLDKQFKRS
jgi:DNA mismatch repair protein MutL